MLLGKRSRESQKDRGSAGRMSFFRFGSRSSSDSDSSKSPTSPLEHKPLNFSSPFIRSPRADGPRRSWECDRVGLGLADVLLERSGSSGILVGNQIRINLSNPMIIPISPPESPKIHKDFSYLELGSSPEDTMAQAETGEIEMIQSCHADYVQQPMAIHESEFRRSSSSELLLATSSVRDVTPGKIEVSLPTSEIEESEDYTRITTHGSNPKTTHIFGDCILDCHPSELASSDEKETSSGPSTLFEVCCSDEIAVPLLAPDFLSFCYTCKDSLEGEIDIYMYRGELAFCSLDCREPLILADEEEEKARAKAEKEKAKAEAARKKEAGVPAMERSQ